MRPERRVVDQRGRCDAVVVTVDVVSEYQYYEFAAVDRPLDERQLAEVRALSTRAHITPTSFVNTYEWGSFRGDPRRMVERFYDAFLYLANWGTRELLLRFPARVLDLDLVRRYCGSEAASAWRSGEQVVVAAVSEDDDGDFEWGGEGVLATILPVRAEVLAGDLRALYVLWLLGVQVGEFDDEVVEPPVPPGLAELTGSQVGLAEFLRIDGDLLAVAAAGSRPQHSAGVDIDRWVAGLAADERDALLLGLLLLGDDPHLRAETLRRARAVPGGDGGGRTVEELLAAAATRRAERERAASVRREQEMAERARRAAPGVSGLQRSRRRARARGLGSRPGSRRRSRQATTPRSSCSRIFGT